MEQQVQRQLSFNSSLMMALQPEVTELTSSKLNTKLWVHGLQDMSPIKLRQSLIILEVLLQITNLVFSQLLTALQLL